MHFKNNFISILYCFPYIQQFPKLLLFLFFCLFELSVYILAAGICFKNKYRNRFSRYYYFKSVLVIIILKVYNNVELHASSTAEKPRREKPVRNFKKKFRLFDCYQFSEIFYLSDFCLIYFFIK